MFKAEDIIYEDNHLMVVNKHSGDLVQPDPDGTSAMEDQIKEFIRVRDSKPGDVYLGVVHRIDRPVSGAVLFAKTSKALVRLNEMIKNREIKKTYWAVTESSPQLIEGELVHYIVRNPKKNTSTAHNKPMLESKEARLAYRVLGSSTNYFLVEIDLQTGRHHQIRCQMAKIGCPIKGDLKYGASRSNPAGGISLHSRRLEFVHPVSKLSMSITAPVPEDNLWQYFEKMNHS